MTIKNELLEERPAKGALVAMSLGSGLLTFIVIGSPEGPWVLGIFAVSSNKWLIGLLIGIIVSIAYPFVAAFAVYLCSGYRNWAYFDQVEPWENSLKITLGAFWPILLIWSAIIYTFLGIVNRLFQKK